MRFFLGVLVSIACASVCTAAVYNSPSPVGVGIAVASVLLALFHVGLGVKVCLP